MRIKGSRMSAKKHMLKHELIPEHSKLSDKEVKELLKSYNINMKELPKILVSDPAIAHLNAKEGDVIKITRMSRTAGEVTFYRGVVKE